MRLANGSPDTGHERLPLPLRHVESRQPRFTLPWLVLWSQQWPVRVKGEDVPTGQKTKRRSPDGDSMPAWKKTSVERSLTNARVRAQERSDRFVNAAMELMHERGSTDFTVQEIIERARMSIRTFYKFFASKDDLLVAVHETIMATEVVPRLRRRCDPVEDPIERVRTYIDALYELTAYPRPASRALSSFRSHLAETRPRSWSTRCDRR